MQETTLSKDDATITRIIINDEMPSQRFGFPVDDEESKTFFHLCSAVYQCGVAARKNQSHIHRSLKADGSILTETDLAVSDAILAKIRELYPDCNIVTEEVDLKDFREGARYTFVLDPIDGTDAYSQGLACWCVSLGILDQNRIPCGGVVFGPRFGIGTEDLFYCSLPGDDKVYLNGELHTCPQHYDVAKQVAIGSECSKYVSLDSFRGKYRNFCSSILNLVAPITFSNIDGCLNGRCYVWDIAGANALLSKLGMSVCYLDGSDVEYDDAILLERKQIKLPILSGTKACICSMFESFPKKG